MGQYLIKNTTREQLEQIRKDALNSGCVSVKMLLEK
jgi:hypothetical protein